MAREYGTPAVFTKLIARQKYNQMLLVAFAIIVVAVSASTYLIFVRPHWGILLFVLAGMLGLLFVVKGA